MKYTDYLSGDDDFKSTTYDDYDSGYDSFEDDYKDDTPKVSDYANTVLDGFKENLYKKINDACYEKISGSGYNRDDYLDYDTSFDED